MSVIGRLIITAIFLLTILAPEVILIVILCAHPGRGLILAISLVRFFLACIIYYFMLAGHGWARWFMAFLLMISIATTVAVAGKHQTTFAIVAAIIFIPSIAILLGLKVVRPDERIRARRHRTHV